MMNTLKHVLGQFACRVSGYAIREKFPNSLFRTFKFFFTKCLFSCFLFSFCSAHVSACFLFQRKYQGALKGIRSLQPIRDSDFVSATREVG